MGWKLLAAFLILSVVTHNRQSFVGTASPVDRGNNGENSYDKVVRELENLKNILGASSGGDREEISVEKSQESFYSNINGRKSLYRQRNGEVNRNGKLLAKVAEKVDLIKERGGKPKSIMSAEVEIPSKGLHVKVKGEPNKEILLNPSNKKRKGNDIIKGSDVKIISPSGMEFSSLDMAEYIFWTGDEKGVAMAIEEFLEQGLISRQKAINFLQSVKLNLDFMQTHYQGLQKIDDKIVNMGNLVHESTNRLRARIVLVLNFQKGPFKMELTQELAQKLFEEGGTCVFLDLPVGSEFGIDMMCFTTGEKFMGVKMIPPGLHIIYYSVENSHGDKSPRVSFMHDFKRHEIVVKKWDKDKQELFNIEDAETLERMKLQLRGIDRFLGAYPYEVYGRWRKLSDKMSSTLVEKMVPSCGWIYSVLELQASHRDDERNKPSTESLKKRKSKLFLCDEKNDDLLPHLKAAEGTELRFSKIPDKCYPENSTPKEITKHSLDSSYLLEQMLLQHEDCIDLLGEIQFSFICFLIGYSFEAFEHWKKLIGIVCSCDDAIPRHLDIFINFITVLKCQLEEVQEDFLVDIVAGNNYVYKVLRVFLRNVYSCVVNGRLKAQAKRFEDHLTEKLGWDFSNVFDEDIEDLPVVVQ